MLPVRARYHHLAVCHRRPELLRLPSPRSSNSTATRHGTGAQASTKLNYEAKLLLRHKFRLGWLQCVSLRHSRRHGISERSRSKTRPRTPHRGTQVRQGASLLRTDVKTNDLFSIACATSEICLLACWNTAFDPEGLAGDYGLRTAERRHPKYFCDKPRPGPGGGCCR